MNRSVLFLVPDLLGAPGGIGRYCRMVCQALTDSDTPLTVLALRDRGTATNEASRNFPRMTYQPCNGSRVSFATQALVAVLRKRPGIILIGHPNFSFLGLLLSRLGGARFATFVYGIDVWTPLAPLRLWALQHADRIFSISCFTMRQAIQANGICPQRIRILFNCLDPIFENVPAVTKSQTSLSMLTVARIESGCQYKGLDQMIRAMPRLLEHFPQLTYHIVGDGPGRPTMERLANNKGVAHAVYFYGTISEEALLKKYNESSVFVMPSRREGFGFVFIEAMSQATPVIGGNLDATPEVILDGETGYVVNPTSIESLVEAVTCLLGDEQRRKQMGQAAFKYARAKFGYHLFKKQLNLYLAELQSKSATISRS